jgi:Fe-S cluster biogenesis protein NfuA/nitrite reductase/ring-hydroxylating ferredoxin subunit
LAHADGRDRVARVETLLDEVESLADPAARQKAVEVVQAVVELYGAGLERMVEEIAERDTDGEVAAALADDELVSHLLLLHDLHPVPLEARVRGALESVRPYMESHGGNVELVDVEDGIVRLRLEGSCEGCPSSATTMKLAVEDAIHKVAPDVEGIEAEGVIDVELVHQPNEGPVLLQLEDRVSRPWIEVPTPTLESGQIELVDVGGSDVLFTKLTTSLYAYRPDCPACGESLTEATLADGWVECSCGERYDVRRAGRSAGAGGAQLQPVPLLHDGNGGVKVALG